MTDQIVDPYAIYLRRGENWDNITAEDHIEKIRKDGFRTYVTTDGHGMFIENLKKWNRRFGMSFVEYRKRLRDIAFESWLRARMNIVGPIPTINKTYAPQHLKAVAVTDDDDVFTSDIYNYISEAFESDPKLKVLHWNSLIYTTFGRATNRHRIWKESVVPHFVHAVQLASNGYAVRTPCRSSWVSNHSTISKDLEVSRDPGLRVYVNKTNLTSTNVETDLGLVRWLPNTLSMYMRHPGSTYLLRTRPLEAFIEPAVRNKAAEPKLPLDLQKIYQESYENDFRHIIELFSYAKQVQSLTNELLSTWR